MLLSFVLELWGINLNEMTEDPGPDYFREIRKRKQKFNESVSISVGSGTNDMGPL